MDRPAICINILIFGPVGIIRVRNRFVFWLVSEQALTEPQTRPHIFKTLVKSLRMSGLVVGGVDLADIVPILTLPDGQKIRLTSDEYPHHVSNWPPALQRKIVRMLEELLQQGHVVSGFYSYCFSLDLTQVTSCRVATTTKNRSSAVILSARLAGILHKPCAYMFPVRLPVFEAPAL